MLLLLPTG